jgi:hypothetical protein
MGNTVALLEKILDLAKQLPLRDKVRLIERIAPQIERELETPMPVPRKSLRGLWRDLDISGKEIDEARQEMWAGFPREDL